MLDTPTTELLVAQPTHETLLLVSFCYQGPGHTYQELVNLLAKTVANAPGLIWKTWFINEEARAAGSLHLFRGEPSLNAYVQGPALAELKHEPCVGDLSVKSFSTLNEIPLIAIRRWQAEEKVGNRDAGV